MELNLLTATVDVGGYLSVWKAIPFLLVVLLWARLLTWADKDAIQAHLPRVALNVGLLLGGILAVAIFFLVPTFALAFIILVVMMLAEAAVYLGMRHQKVGLGDLKEQFTEWIQSFTKGDKKVVEVAGQVQLIDRTANLMAVPDNEAPERPGYEALQSMLSEALRRNAEQVDVTPSGQSAGVKYQVDGVAYGGGEMGRESAAAAITYMKQAAGLRVDERRKPQSGTLRLIFAGKRREFQIQTAGSTAGEHLRLIADPTKRHSLKLEELGLSEAQYTMLKASIGENKGVVLVAAPKDQGLTSMLYALIRGHDAFLSHIQTIERNPDQDLEGVTQNRLSSNATPEDELKQVAWVTSTEPDTIMINQIENPKSAANLIDFASKGRRVYVGMRAANTFEALEKWRKLLGKDKLAVAHLELIISGRVMRKLCMACKVPYQPDPGTLRKLNIDPEKVTELYQARIEPLRDAKGNPVSCEFCHDLSFKGRMGVYETFTINDEVRQVVLAGGTSNQLKAVFRKQRGRFLQEEALERVQKGDTSIQEVRRVLRAGEESSSAAAPARAPAPAQASPPLNPSAS